MGSVCRMAMPRIDNPNYIGEWKPRLGVAVANCDVILGQQLGKVFKSPKSCGSKCCTPKMECPRSQALAAAFPAGRLPTPNSLRMSTLPGISWDGAMRNPEEQRNTKER